MRSSVILATALASPAFADTTISPTGKFAYSANAGPINFRPEQPAPLEGIVVGDFFLTGHAYGANVGWMNFGNGEPADGIAYRNNSATDFGVNHDGAGNLGGMAYGANIGWINFGWAAANDPLRPRLHLLTGQFSGFAYSGNLGWINLGSDSLTTTAIRITDGDHDGIADAWERGYFNNLTTAGLATDADQDGAGDVSEYEAGTAPNSPSDYFRVIHTVAHGAANQATMTFTTAATRVYRIEISDNLSVWTNSGLGTFTPDSGPTTTRLFSWSGGAWTGSGLFFRAVAARPLSN
jgi:hypothetical protein